ncbi:MAG: PAS domain-containing protein [Limisphaerales bacterium]
MSWVTIIWSMIASVSFTLATIYLLIWFRERRSWAYLCFFVLAAGVIGMSAGEFGAMYAKSPAEYGAAIRWGHFAFGFIVVGSLGFVHFYFGTGKTWLLGAALGLRLLAVAVNFSTGLNLHIRAIQSLQQVNFLGEPVSMLGVWTPNPWVRLGQLAALVQVVYVVDASLRLWRAGAHESRRRALMVGGPLAFFILFSSAQAGLVTAGVLRMPIIVSFPFLAVLLAMGYELSRDVLRAAQLGRQLQESEQQMALATEAANLGVWVRDLVQNEIWASDKWRSLFGFPSSERLDLEKYLQRLHPDDRETVRQTLVNATNGAGRYETEYRVMLPDGQLRWIASRGRVEFNGGGKPVRVRGASLDITARKQAEESAQNLSGRLIHAQEAERMRLARELHDDLSQSLALLAVELDMFGQKPATTGGISGRMQEFSAQVRGLSSGVHRLSHELHPAKLEQLGLAAAVRGFCKEFGAAHKIAVEFEPHEVPRALPDDIALCLYRIVQEGLQNVVKHSGAAGAKVALTADAKELCLVVSDQGCGFDSLAVGGGSLGLVSMRERVRLVRGHISVQSRKGASTRIEVHIPLGGLHESFACAVETN